jgi:hypothetical protein
MMKRSSIAAVILALGLCFALPNPAFAQPDAGGATAVSGPRFTIEATKFRAVNETWYDWAGSDEIVFEYQVNDRTMISGIYESVDAGDVLAINGGQRCIYPAFDPDRRRNARWSCAPAGGPAPVTVTINLYEFDGSLDQTPLATFCVGRGRGDDSDVACAFETEFASRLGRYRLTFSQSELLRAMPQIGMWMTKTIRIDSCSAMITVANGACSGATWLPGYFAYDVTLLVRRQPNGGGTVVER